MPAMHVSHAGSRNGNLSVFALAHVLGAFFVSRHFRTPGELRKIGKFFGVTPEVSLAFLEMCTQDCFSDTPAHADVFFSLEVIRIL